MPVESQEEALKVAEDYARRMNFRIPRTQVPVVKRFTTPENDVLASVPRTNDYTERIRRALGDRVYWTVYYRAAPTQLGGEYAFFVDERTGSILAYYAGR
jgi:hypothetical protein